MQCGAACLTPLAALGNCLLLEISPAAALALLFGETVLSQPSWPSLYHTVHV